MYVSGGFPESGGVGLGGLFDLVISSALFSAHASPLLFFCPWPQSLRTRGGVKLVVVVAVGWGWWGNNEDSLVSPRLHDALYIKGHSGPASIRAAAHQRDTPPLIHNETQLLATARASPAKSCREATISG